MKIPFVYEWNIGCQRLIFTIFLLSVGIISVWKNVISLWSMHTVQFLIRIFMMQCFLLNDVTLQQMNHNISNRLLA